MVKCIGIKDDEGNDIMLIRHNKPLPNNFYDNYKLKEVSMIQGDNMARMIVTKI